MRDNTREAFRLAADKARKLTNIRYAQYLRLNRGTALRISQEPDGNVKVEHTRPDEDATDALVLTLRFFIQENEATSFRWLANNVMDDAGLSQTWKQEFTKVRNWLNARLQLPTNMGEIEVQQVTDGGTVSSRLVQQPSPTKGEILQVFVYGDLAHANPSKRELYQRWRARPIAAEKFMMEFDLVLMDVLRAVERLGYLCEGELAAELSSGASGTNDSTGVK